VNNAGRVELCMMQMCLLLPSIPFSIPIIPSISLIPLSPSIRIMLPLPLPISPWHLRSPPLRVLDP